MVPPPDAQQGRVECCRWTLCFHNDTDLEHSFLHYYNASFRIFDMIWNAISLLLCLGLASKLPGGMTSQEGLQILLTQAGRIACLLLPYGLTPVQGLGRSGASGVDAIDRGGGGRERGGSNSGSNSGSRGAFQPQEQQQHQDHHQQQQQQQHADEQDNATAKLLRRRATLRMVCLSLLKAQRVLYPWTWRVGGGLTAATSCESLKAAVFELTVSFFFSSWVWPTPFRFDAPIHLAALAAELAIVLPRSTGLCARIAANPACAPMMRGFRVWAGRLNAAGALLAPELPRLTALSGEPELYCRVTLGFAIAACAVLSLYGEWLYEAAQRRRFLQRLGLPDSGVPRARLGAAEAMVVVTAAVALWMAVAASAGVLVSPNFAVAA